MAEALANLPSTLNFDSERTKSLLLRQVSEIRMIPVKKNGEKFYVAEGEWFIDEKEKVTGAMLNGDFRMVAGAGFEPATFGL